MEFLSIAKFAEKYGLAERTVRNYCAQGKIDGLQEWTRVRGYLLDTCLLA